jgi:hypothetical protein
MSTITVTTGGDPVTSIVSDPLNQAVYTFTGGTLTLAPVVGYSMQLSNFNYHTPLCAISSNPFTLTIPPQTTPTVGEGPMVISANANYLLQCSTTGGNSWYLEFSFDLMQFTKIESNFHLGTCNAYVHEIGYSDISRAYVLNYNIGLSYSNSVVLSNSQATVRFQFPGDGTVNVVVNGLTTSGSPYSIVPNYEIIVFSDLYTDYYRIAPLTMVPLVISNIALGLPTQTFTPSLLYNTSSTELLPFLYKDPTGTPSNIVTFTTPLGQISTGLNAPVIAIDQTLSNEIQATATYTVTQVGTIPPVTIVTDPDFPSVIRIKELIPFSYSFTTTNYYPPTSTTPTFLSTGATPVTITGTSNALITLPAKFKDVNVTGDRMYTYGFLSDNKISLSIALPFFTDPVDTAFIGFGGILTAQIVGGGTGTNQLLVNGYYLSPYAGPQTLVYVPVPTPNPSLGNTFQLYQVDSMGNSHLVYDGIYIPNGFLLSFSMHFTSGSGYGGSATSVTVNAPAITQVTLGAPLPVNLDPYASGTNYLLDYATGNGTANLVVASDVGFSTLPPVVPILFRVDALFNGTTVVAAVQSQLSVLQGIIVSTPDIYDFPPPAYIYIPFGAPYVFSLPKTPNTTLVFYNSDPIIRTYLTADTVANTITFNAPNGYTSAITNGLLSIQAIDQNNAVIATINYYINASSNIITSAPPFTGSITLYKYEPFSYSYGFVSGVTGLTLNANASSAEVRTFVTPTTPGITLTYAGTYKSSFANIVNLIVTVYNSSNAIVTSLSNAVTVNPGRFYNPVNTVFSFYQYEDIALTYGGNIAFDTAASLDAPPASTPALPIGLSFASVAGSSNNFVMKGTPQFQTPSNQYLILGVNSLTGQTVTKRITIVVNPPRIKISPSPATVSGMQIGVPITPVVFTSIQPSALTILDFQYDWDTLPDGLYFTDINSNVVQQPYHAYPSDPTLTIILAGTPTSNAAYAFVNSGFNLSNVNLYAFQYQPKGVQTNQKALISFSFGELILFDPVFVPPLYASQALKPSTLIIKASSYFPSGDPINSITVSGLPDGLSISNAVTGLPNYVNLNDYGNGIFVYGTPTTVSTGVYTFTATSDGGYSRSVDVTIPILQDVITFTSVTPAAVSFIVSRPITLDYNLVFTAVSPIVNQTIEYSTSFDVTQYGLVLTTANGSATLTGTPTQPLPTTTLIITATDTLGTFGNVSLQITINADQFTFNSPALNFIQHVPITPVQFTATTTSQRAVISFTSSDLPQGLLLSALGLLTGTPYTSTSGTFGIKGSTGYPPGVTHTFSYNMVSDNAVILLTSNPLLIPSATFSVDAFRSFTYSGNTPTLAVDQDSIKDKNGGTTLIPTLSMNGTFLVGAFPSGAQAYSPFIFNVIATYLNTTASLAVTLTYNGTTGLLSASSSPGSLVFTSPASLNYLFYQHCPIPPITLRISGATGFTYFYTIVSNLPIGLTFTPDPSGTFATISGTPAVYNDALVGVTVYAVNNANITFETIQIRVITPFFVNPQSNGSSAYTALLRNQTLVNAAQNARDNVVFPTTDASLGYLQSPGAPDVNSPPIPCIEPKQK